MGSVHHVETLDQGLSHPRKDGMEQHEVPHATQNGSQFKVYALFISGSFHGTFSDHG